jgi:hypothetical protein
VDDQLPPEENLAHEIGRTSSPVPKIARRQLTPAEGSVDEEESGEEVGLTCYWWISTSKPSLDDAPPGDKTFLSFSIPTSLLPVPHQPALDSDGDVIMGIPEQAAAATVGSTGPGCLLCGRMHGNEEV